MRFRARCARRLDCKAMRERKTSRTRVDWLGDLDGGDERCYVQEFAAGGGDGWAAGFHGVDLVIGRLVLIFCGGLGLRKRDLAHPHFGFVTPF